MTELRVDPLVSFVVPVYKTDKDVFKRCLMSLFNQDYKNIEVIVVFDGIDQDLIQVATPFLSEVGRIKIIEVEHKGACAARNAGFRVSNGEILSFFNSDYIAKPGMTRLWVDALQDHPEYGFVYGGYEYATSQRAGYMSKEFNEYDLTQANYIDCGFPLWRKHVVEWDENCKSLQDWDFWIRVVKNGVKGYFYEREPFYVAQLPRPGGLSYDSNDHWVERVTYVREKNGIPSYPMVVTSIGAFNHAREIAQLLKADCRDTGTIFKPNDYKALYMIGFYFKPDGGRNYHPDILEKFTKPGVKKIVHFVGADIFWLRKFKFEELRYVAGVLNQEVDYILCETEMARAELASMGIESEVVPIPTYSDLTFKPLPEKFSVAIFLTNKSDFDKYCKEETLSIVRALPNVQFNAYGDAGSDIAYPNFKHVGNLTRKEWEQFVYDNSCYIRLVRHDTRPLATDEFLMAGREVITNIPGYGVHYISTAGDKSKMEFDDFQVGLNDYYWPKKKGEIVQKILDIRDNPKPENSRISLSEELRAELDKSEYIKKIYEMAEIPVKGEGALCQ
jgi:glycosyltransferase involved in cell wall biosynthesis